MEFVIDTNKSPSIHRQGKCYLCLIKKEKHIQVKKQSIGIFDSGYGGLTIFKEIQAALPAYDYIYLGDNARAPYGERDFETIYAYTLEAVEWFYKQGCALVILACNTASAKALRTIQQKDLPERFDMDFRVLGVVRPTTEHIGFWTASGHVGIMATSGTVRSNSYPIEIAKFFPSLKVYQQACPMWVPLIENQEHTGRGADFFVKKYCDALLAQSSKIDTILLGCTHYPLILNKIKAFLPKNVGVRTQGEVVAERFVDYLERHENIKNRLSETSTIRFFTTGAAADFNVRAADFFGKKIEARFVRL